MKFIVITGVPDMEDPRDAVGNLASLFELYEEHGEGRVRRLSPLYALSLRVPVFHVGELIVTSDGERELGYPQRKPSKWGVTYDTYDQLDDAVERVRELLQ